MQPSGCLLRKRTRLGERQADGPLPVLIDEAEALPPRDHLRRQRIVAERRAADTRRDCADVGRLLELDAKQPQHAPVGMPAHKGNLREPQKARRVRRLRKILREARLDQVEIGLGNARRLIRVVMRLLPLRYLRRGVVTGGRREPITTHAASGMMSVMVMTVAMVVPMVMIAIVHRSLPAQ